MTAPATVKLPRVLFFVLAFVYIVAGLLGRDPWKTDDVVGLATMLSALRDQSSWLTPHIGPLALAFVLESAPRASRGSVGVGGGFTDPVLSKAHPLSARGR